MLRVHRLAAAIDMIAAGTSAPMPIAANATPANQLGNSFSNSCGTACWAFSTWTPAAMATKPSRAISPRRKEYAGSSAALRRITERFLVASTPVIEWGYMNSAIAEPRASEAYAQCAASGGIITRPLTWPAAMASAFSALKASKLSVAALKTLSQPPTCEGR